MDFSNLTPREIDVLNAGLDGASQDTVAKRAFLSIGTVKFHRRNTMNKLGFQSTAQLLIAVNRSNGGNWLSGGDNRINPAITPDFPEYLISAKKAA